MFKIRELADDADALVVLVTAFLLALLVAFLPDVAWDRLVERATFLFTIGGGVLATVALRYLLRIAGAVQAGKVLAQAAADPNSPEVITLVEHGTQPQAASTPAGTELTDGDLAELDHAHEG